MTFARHLAAVYLLASLTACAPWSRVDPSTRLETRSDDYSIELPVGWVKQTAGANDIFITRDGPALNYIAVTRQSHTRKLPYTKRETRADLLPHELAELVVAEWKGAEATANMEIISNAPLLLDSRPADRTRHRHAGRRTRPADAILRGTGHRLFPARPAGFRRHARQPALPRGPAQTIK